MKKQSQTVVTRDVNRPDSDIHGISLIKYTDIQILNRILFTDIQGYRISIYMLYTYTHIHAI